MPFSKQISKQEDQDLGMLTAYSETLLNQTSKRNIFLKAVLQTEFLSQIRVQSSGKLHEMQPLFPKESESTSKEMKEM